MKKKNKMKISFWLTLFSGTAFAYFLWISWRKLTELIGNTNIAWGITGGIVLLAILTGYFSFDKIAKKFTN